MSTVREAGTPSRPSPSTDSGQASQTGEGVRRVSKLTGLATRHGIVSERERAVRERPLREHARALSCARPFDRLRANGLGAKA